MCGKHRHRMRRCGLCEFLRSIPELFPSPNDQARERAEGTAIFRFLTRTQGVVSANKTLSILAARNRAHVRRRFPWRLRLSA